jgi:hypothetical protein
MSNPLGTYLDRVGEADGDFGARIGRDRTMVSKLRRGLIRPTLDLAATIERETSGAVPMKAWVAAAAEQAAA